MDGGIRPVKGGMRLQVAVREGNYQESCTWTWTSRQCRTCSIGRNRESASPSPAFPGYRNSTKIPNTGLTLAFTSQCQTQLLCMSFFLPLQTHISTSFSYPLSNFTFRCVVPCPGFFTSSASMKTPDLLTCDLQHQGGTTRRRSICLRSSAASSKQL